MKAPALYGQFGSSLQAPTPALAGAGLLTPTKIGSGIGKGASSL